MSNNNFLDEGLEKSIEERKEKIRTNLIFIGLVLISICSIIYLFVFPFYR